MPPQKKTGGLMAKYGAKLDAAVKKHANDPTDYGQMRLPGGIKNGIARLVTAEFNTFKPGTANAGEYYFRAAGVVVEPKTVDVDGQTVSVEGMQTSIILPVCATGQGDKHRTQEQNVAAILNEFRKLGMDTAGAGLGELEAMAEALVEAAPFFRFETRTSEATYNPDGTQKYAARVWESWYGNKGLSYTPAADDGTEDNTGDEPPARPAKAGKARPALTEPDPEPADEGSGSDDGGIDYTSMSLDDLVTMADPGGDNDDGAQQEIERRGEEAGVGDEVRSAQDWESAAKIIEEATQAKPAKGGKGKTGAPAQAVVPKVGETYSYAPPDPKKPGQQGKPVEVTVTAVVGKMKICSVADVANPKRKWDQVPFADLHQPF